MKCMLALGHGCDGKVVFRSISMKGTSSSWMKVLPPKFIP